MNININLADILGLSMGQTVLVVVGLLLAVLIWQLSNIINAVVNFLRFAQGGGD